MTKKIMPQNNSKIQGKFYPLQNRDWKEALGKILAYAAFFLSHDKRIHLFGKPNLPKLSLAQALSAEFGVSVTFEEVEGEY